MGNVKFYTGNGGKTEFWLKKGVQKSVENDDYEKIFSAKSFFGLIQLSMRKK